MNTLMQLTQYAQNTLQNQYSQSEIKSLCNIIFMDALQFTNIDIHLRKNEILTEDDVNKFCEIVKRLVGGEPLQYIIGSTEFAGLRFVLNSSTLIPRPETYELIEWAQSYVKSGDKILDIGTGSGCIAVTLAHLCSEASVVAVDISEDACNVARQNALANSVEIETKVCDVLQFEDYAWNEYDIIISNPPYIKDEEKTEIESNVLDYEPHRALFVPDNDPLIFYRRICELGSKYLKCGGYLFFEINQMLGQETLELVIAYGYQEVELRKDIYNNDRMIKARKL